MGSSPSDFEFLDHLELASPYLIQTDPPRLRFFVEGVKCSRCLWKIEEGVGSLPGVQWARLDMAHHLLTVEMAPDQALFSTVAEKLKTLGFRPFALKTEGDGSTNSIKQQRQMLNRLAVAGFCMGTIMLLSVSLYGGGADSEFRDLLNWWSMIAFLPSLVYSAWPFYVESWRKLRMGKPSVDLPIVAAILIGFGLSLIQISSSQGEGYFDSLSMLIFLLLSARFYLYRIHQRFLNPNLLNPYLEVSRVRKWETNAWRDVPAKLVHVGDLVRVDMNERLPVDGELEQDEAFLNLAVLNGEPEAVCVRRGEKVFAGSRLLTNQARIRVSQVGPETRIGQLFQKMEQSLLSRTPLVDFADRVGRRFTWTLLLLSGGFAIAYAFVDPFEGVQRSLALIVLACPCALAFATPLTHSLALMRSARRGWFIKNAVSLEKLVHVQHIVFDKTGTLTKGELSLLSFHPRQPTEDEKQIIVSLESDSEHPIAKCLRRHMGNLPKQQMVKLKETFGVGVSGQLGEDRYCLRRAPDTETFRMSSLVGFYKNDQLQFTIELGDEIRPDAAHTLTQLRQMGLKVHLLTGDRHSSAELMGERLGFQSHEIHAEMSPEQKAQFVAGLDRPLMIGDGINDAVAMSMAHVSIAVQGSMEASLRAADIYLAEPGVQAVEQLIHVARDSFYVIQRNLAFSLIYNCIGGSLALMGLINPLIAAVLMPLSSLTVVSSALFGTRFLRQFKDDAQSLPLLDERTELTPGVIA